MNEIVFAPDSGASVLVWMGLVVTAIAAGVVALLARKNDVEARVYGGPAIFAALGLALLFMGLMDARSVTFAPGHVVLNYNWPRSSVPLALDEIREARIEMRGSKRPSPRLVIELRDGTTYEGEGTSRAEQVYAAKAAISRLLHDENRF